MTTREILSQLPLEIAKRAIANANYPDHENSQSLSDCISGAFMWRCSPEGLSYWNGVYEATLGENEYPKLP